MGLVGWLVGWIGRYSDFRETQIEELWMWGPLSTSIILFMGLYCGIWMFGSFRERVKLGRRKRNSFYTAHTFVLCT